MSIFNNKNIVKHSPIVTTIMFEAANIQHVIRMVSEQSAVGQSLSAWITVNFGLLLWYNWYRVFTPNDKIVQNVTILSMLLNTIVIFTIIYFRYAA